MPKHFLQSDSWAAFQKEQGKEVIIREGKGWSYLGVIEKPKGKVGRLHYRLYAPYGPTCSDSAALQAALKDMSDQAKQRGLTYIRIEPIVAKGTVDMKKLGGQKKTRAYQPDRTHLIDLTQSEADIFKAMSGTNRNLWNTHEQKGLVLRKSYNLEDLKPFLKMMHHTAARTGIIQHPDSYFEAMARALFPSKAAGLVFGELAGKPIVTAMFYDNLEAGIRYYAFAGSFDEARKLQANSPLVTYLMLDAKAAGLKVFDLYGVAPEGDEAHKWAGHSKFKRSFGGFDHEYLGTWEIPVKRLAFTLAQLARRIRS